MTRRKRTLNIGICINRLTDFFIIIQEDRDVVVDDLGSKPTVTFVTVTALPVCICNLNVFKDRM